MPNRFRYGFPADPPLSPTAGFGSAGMGKIVPPALDLFSFQCNPVSIIIFA